MLSGLNINMGILESPVPDLFNDVHYAVSTWKSDFFTINGSNELTYLANTGGDPLLSMGGFYAGGSQVLSVLTDGDGTKWIDDNGVAWPNYHAMQAPVSAQTAMSTDTAGTIWTASLRAVRDQAVGTGPLDGWGPGGGMSGSTVFAMASGSSSGSSDPMYDMEFHTQMTNNFAVFPGGDTYAHFGPYKGELGTGGGLTEGGYSPLGNNFLVPAYLQDQNVVVSLFMQATGMRMMINGQFVRMYVRLCRDKDGFPKIAPRDEAAETAFFAQDFSHIALITRAGGTPGVDLLPFFFQCQDTLKTDYMAVHSGEKSDDYMKLVHSQLLHAKPT